MSSRTDSFVKPIRKLLTEQEEQEKFIAWKQTREAGDEKKAKKLFEELILHYTPIIRKWAKKMSGYGIDPDDLISEGLLALVQAAERFDLSLGNRFSTFASCYIKGTLFAYVSKNYFLTNVCSSSVNKKLFFSMRGYMVREVRRTGTFELTDDLIREMAKKFEVKPEDIIRMHHLLRSPYESLQEVVAGEDEGGLTKEDLLECPNMNAEDQLIQTTTDDYRKTLIQVAMTKLDHRERAIFQAQLLQDNSDTLEELGNQFHISKERVRQIRNNATDKVKKSVIEQMARSRITPTELFA